MKCKCVKWPLSFLFSELRKFESKLFKCVKECIFVLGPLECSPPHCIKPDFLKSISSEGYWHRRGTPASLTHRTEAAGLQVQCLRALQSEVKARHCGTVSASQVKAEGAASGGRLPACDTIASVSLMLLNSSSVKHR